jgi:exocyst complex protein 7
LHPSEEEAAPELLDAGLLAMALKHLEGEFKRLVQEHSRVMELPATLMPSETSLDDVGPMDLLLPPRVGFPAQDAAIDLLLLGFPSKDTMDLLPPAAGFPPEVIQKLHAILERVRAHNRHHSCLKVYQETRSIQTRLSLQALHVQYLKNMTPDLVDGVEWEELQNMIGLWIQHLQVTVKVLYAHERRLACVVFKDLGQSVWAECVGKLAHAGMTAFLQFGEAVARSRRSPEKLCGLLDMFDAMEKSAKSILRVFDGETDGIRSRFRDLQKQVQNCYLIVFWQ